ncbi:beta-propeller domain-containing protein [Actinokineospora sp. 24-640]
MRTESRRWPSIGTATAAIAALGAVVIGAAWYVGDTDTTAAPTPPADLGGQIRLVAYDTCDAALADLKRAGLAKVGPWGLEGSAMVFGRGAMAVEDSAAAGSAPDKGFSSTNVHEAAADEPDVVKTDGRRIVSVVDGKLRVVDVAARRLEAGIALPGHADSVLIDGDRALVSFMPEHAPDAYIERGGLALVDLAERRVLRTLTVDGATLDARMVGSVARIVVRSAPRLEFSFPDEAGEEDKATQRNRGVIQRSTIDDWLPRYTLEPGGGGRLVDCAALSRPADYTGTALLSVLSVDLRADLTTQDTIAIAADGDTIYGNGTSLYVADDRTPRSNVIFSTADTSRPSTPPGPAKTAIHQFDVAQPGKPAYLASGEVDGWLLNQYSLSEHDGRLRVATTTGSAMGWGPASEEEARKSESAVAVLERRDQKLAQVGRVGGLGKGEQIQSVRYLGDTAYVVTFRRTDPLYAVDLSDPAAPKVTGELKITGFSAYLHPIGDGRLLGVGQEATEEGRTTGSQVSLFDVSGPVPSRIAQHHEPDTYSVVEHDPHAFLYYAERDLVVLPVSGANGGGAVLLRVTPDKLTKIGTVVNPGQHDYVSRTVIAGDALWTFSHGGVQASGLDSLDKLAWLPFG